MLLPARQLSNVLCSLCIIMSLNGPPRSRSPRTNGNNGDDNKDTADTSELETKMLDMWTKKIKPLADEMHETNQKAIQEMVIKTVSSEIGQLKSQVVGLETSVVGLETTVGDVKSEIGDVKKAVERIELALAAPSALPPPASPPLPSGGSQVRQGTSRPQSFADAVAMGTPNLGSQQPVGRDVTTPNFNRKLDPTKLFCNLHERAKVSKSLFQKAISVLANEAAISDTEYCISGDPLDNRFEIQFAGDVRVASVCALQFYESLYLGRGQRKEQVVADDQGKNIKFYIAPDKNPCQIRREILGGKLVWHSGPQSH